MNRYLLRLEYLGLNYYGSQKQPDKNTIQEEIEKALCTLIKNKISTIFSGRTDSKVSAKSATAHFECEQEFNEYKFLNSLNGILPDDIRVFEIKKVDKTFHAQKSAKYRHYCYTIRNDKIKSAFDLTVNHIRHPLSEKRMSEALKMLEGEFDFSAFKSHSDNPAKICQIYWTDVARSDCGKYIKIHIIGNRFLYNMVRTIVGTLLMIEKDKLEPLSMLEILNSKDRSKAGATAPAQGLMLEYVGYDDWQEYIKYIGKVNK